ncbi:hypothetical protein ACXYTJ_00240 [Gilvimarinus sp. F26214L]|uniref:hypothetical protein n=1 Tax=Gilvimarinus sp. DZF01 TaxID=3461371 RepID=UPI0040461392
MKLEQLLDRLKMDHLHDSLDTLCEHASKADLNYREFLDGGFGKNGTFYDHLAKILTGRAQNRVTPISR